MPKIPLPEYMQAQEAPLSPPGGGLEPGVLGNLGAGLQALGQSIDRMTSTAVATGLDVYRKERQRALAEGLTNNMQALQGTINDGLYDPENGLMSKRGDAALQAAGSVYQGFQKKAQDLLDNMQDPEQRRIFAARSQSMLEEAHKTSEIYVGRQRLEAQEASANGMVATSLDALAKNYATDPETRAKLIAQPEGSIKALALSPEDAQAKLAAWHQKAAETILNGYIGNRDPQGAQAYFAQAKDELGTLAPQYQHQISTLQSQTAGDQTALTALNSVRGPDTILDGTRIRGFIRNEGEALKTIQDMPAGPDKQAALESYRTNLSLEKAAETNVKASVFQSALSAAIKGGGVSAIPATTVAWMKDNDPEGFASLGRTVQRDENATPQETAAYATVVSDIERNPLRYKNMSPEQFTYAVAPVLSRRDFRTAMSKFTEAQRAKDYSLPETATTVNQLFQRAFGLPAADPKKWPDDKQELWRDVHDYVERKATNYIIDHNGKRPNDQELERIANERLVKGTVVGGGTLFGDKSGLPLVQAEHTPKFQGKQFLEDIPDATRGAIVAKFKARGVKPTEAQIRTAYEKSKGAE